MNTQGKLIKFAILANLILTPCMRLGYRKEFPAPELANDLSGMQPKPDRQNTWLGDGVTECTPPLSIGAAG